VKLKEWREKRGLSQEKLAECVGVHENTIRKWEKSYREPRASDIAKLAQALHVTEAELLNGPENNKITIEVVFGKMDEEEVLDMSKSGGNKFKLFFDNDGAIGIHGGAKFHSLEDIDNFLADARGELVQSFAFQQSRGALPAMA